MDRSPTARKIVKAHSERGCRNNNRSSRWPQPLLDGHFLVLVTHAASADASTTGPDLVSLRDYII